MLDISPKNVDAFNNLDINNIIQIQNQNQLPISNYTLTRNSDGTVTMAVDYNNDIQNQIMNIIVNPSLANNTLFSKANNAQINVLLNPDNNQAAYFYDSSTYSNSQMIGKLSTAVSATAMVFLVVGIFCGKMVGV